MTEYPVKDSHRNVMKRMRKAMRKSYLKVLTEPITNSDDTYKRLNVEEKQPIFIYVTEKERKFEVVDYGEGLDSEQMEDIFKWYGQERKTHDTASRGLFCQGISDVLFTRKKGGHIWSIKNEEVFHIEFKWKRVNKRKEKERIIRLEDKKMKATKEKRKKLKIPQGNGTNVTFHFTEAKFPNEEEIVKKLCSFYMLRLITSDPLREVKLIFLENNKPVKKIPIENVPLEGKELGEIDKEITYKRYSKIRVRGRLFMSDDELSQDEAGEDREGGLLIYDEYRSVYDLTLFGYDDNPHARKLFGYIELSSDYKLGNINGFKQILRNELNNGTDILTDTRDGFVKSRNKSSFYHKLKAIVDGWLKKFVEEETKKQNQGHSNLSDDSIQAQKKAWNILNKLYAEYNEITSLGNDPGKKDKKPENGLEFDRRSSTITRNKKYYIGLRVDVEKIPIGSNVRIFSSSALKSKPRYVRVTRGNEFGIFKKNILIEGNLPESKNKEQAELLALCKEYQSRVDVTITEEEIYEPKEGFEFNPKEYRSKSGNVNKLCLYIDKNIVPLGTMVKLEVIEGKKIRLTEFDEIVFSQNHILNGNIGIIKIPYIGYKDQERGKIRAHVDCRESFAKIRITYKEPKERGKMFEDWEYKPLPTPLETYYNEDTRKIEINASVETNKKFLGNDYSEATWRYENFLHCQILIAERILDECITATISKAHADGKQIFGDTIDPLLALRRRIAEEKSRIGPKIIKYFVKEESMKEVCESIERKFSSI